MEENIWEEVTERDHLLQFDTDEFVIIDNTSSSEASIFPPDNHQDLPLTTPDYSESEEDISHKIHQVPQGGGDDGRWKECLKIINSGIFRVAYKFRFLAVYVAKLWPLAAAGLVVIVLYRKMKKWGRRPEKYEDHWRLLSREKDQKINHLLLQIAKMNEILSASQRVPVHRVV
ncbi:hypothetical protein DCAR_0207437 [Daucus carota subsp. sativus]|uniref:Transmembrane protein n=1 Tax=Daucus carota subsp. sativus TaxID=79200 RepID=A0AAF0WH10_DAUCS|nr:PREDICTED: uncharacterized protein LOC108207926 [Daucus carota subsp. sativus]WOG88203.1 hypothetical protein DCAR_0207437 [Daucus carota subsp. sativus]